MAALPLIKDIRGRRLTTQTDVSARSKIRLAGAMSGKADLRLTVTEIGATAGGHDRARHLAYEGY